MTTSTLENIQIELETTIQDLELEQEGTYKYLGYNTPKWKERLESSTIAEYEW